METESVGNSIDTVAHNLAENLVIGDESKIINDTRHKEHHREMSKEEYTLVIENDMLPEPTEICQDSEEGEDDEDLLAACINVGMQNNR